MATQPHGREVENALDDGSAAKAKQPAELEATHDRPQGELVTNQDSSALIAENQRLKAKILVLVKELEKRFDNAARNYKSLAEIRQNHTEIEQSLVAERQAATERIEMLEAECNLLRDDNKQMDINHRDALSASNNWKDRYHDQQTNMRVLRARSVWLEDQLTATRNERNSEQQAANNKISEVSQECGRLRKQIDTTQSELAAKVEEAREAETWREAADWRAAKIQGEREKLREQAARRVTELEEECKRWKEEFSNCKTQLDVEAVSKAAFAARLEQASKRIREFEEECNRLKEKMTADTKNASDQISELNIECQMHRRRATDLQQECLGYETQVATIEERSQERVATAERKLATKTEEAHEANVKLKDAVKRVHELEIMSKRKETEISTQKNLLSLATAAKADRTTKLEQASKQIRELQEQNEHLRKEQTETAAEKNQALDEIAKLKEECRLYKEQANEFEEEL
ncbi:hypothetical protein N0V85_005914 [Neurospora sp. IMI 360204]|nr:hypothetical protein N0V85_005914 [Neurospora sp. IMI 360204]